MPQRPKPLPKHRNTRVFTGLGCACLLAAIGMAWLLWGRGRAQNGPPDARAGAGSVDLPEKPSGDDLNRVRGPIIATTQAIVRSHMPFGQSARFLPGARLGPAFKGLLLVSGHLQADTGAGQREVSLYEAYIKYLPEDGEVRLWMLDLNGQALYLSEEAQVFRQFGGNKFAGTPAEELQWARAIETVEAVIQRQLGGRLRTEGQGRNRRPWCMQLKNTWAVGGTAVTSDGQGHAFAAEVSRDSGRVTKYMIDDKEFDAAEAPQE